MAGGVRDVKRPQLSYRGVAAFCTNMLLLEVRAARTRWTNPLRPRCPTKGRTVPTSPHRWNRPNSHHLAAP